MRKFIKAVRVALFGMKFFLQERNFLIHIFVFTMICLAGLLFRITQIEWLSILIISAVVFTAEGFNTALEEVSNRMRDDLGLTYEHSGLMRDLSAAAVLIPASFALIIGIFIFTPYIIEFLRNFI